MKNENGYTLIFAVVLMAVLVIIGVSVLIAAANSLNAVNKRVEGRQAYYAAKSALNVFDASLGSKAQGSLGDIIRCKAYDTLPPAVMEGENSGSINTFDVDATSVEFSGSEDLKNIKIKDLKIVCTGEPTISDDSEIGEVSKWIILQNVNISFRVISGREQYEISADYSYTGKATEKNSGGVKKLVWVSELWQLKKIGQ